MLTKDARPENVPPTPCLTRILKLWLSNGIAQAWSVLD